MIRALKKEEENFIMTVAEGWQLFRIRSLLRAYGTGYGFCRFYLQEESGALLCVTGDEAIISVDGTADWRELAEYICAAGVRGLSAAGAAGAALRPFLPGACCTGTVLEYNGQRPMPQRFEVCSSPEPAETMARLKMAYDILTSCFSFGDFDSWYCDVSHQIRHDTARVYLWENAACAVTLQDRERLYLSALAVLPERQGSGAGSSLVRALLRKSRASTAAVYSKDGRTDRFYQRLGFSESGRWYLYSF